MASAFFNFFGINEIDWRKINKSNIFEKISEGIQHSLGSEFISNIDVKSAADRTISDLMIFKSLSRSIGFNLLFCLQPVAGWMQKPLTPQEKTLFGSISRQASEVMSQFSELSVYKEYDHILRTFCKTNAIEYHDLNKGLKVGENWTFVDGVHLTDFGYNKIAEYLSNKF